MSHLPCGNKPKAQIFGGVGGGRWGDGREVLASSRSFSASISSAVSEARVTGPLSNLLSPAFPGITAGLGSPPAACPTLLQGWQQAGESSSLQRRRFLETRNYQAGPNAPSAKQHLHGGCRAGSVSTVLQPPSKTHC